MSAITGIYHLNKEPINLQNVEKLMRELQKYPFDDIQTWHGKSIFLGCHAQWITPESVNEQLPFYDYGRKLSITADVIIDNRLELFDSLNINRNDRKLITDSQLILLAYEKWGEETPKYLVGDFSFMIWDQKEQKIFGARDFSGSRMLYYYSNDEKFAFCSLIEPLLSLPFVEKNLNEQWLAQYLATSGFFDTVEASITPYLHIKQVPPSHSISVTKGRVIIKRYSHLKSEKKLKLKSDDEYVEAFQSVFQDAVSSRLRTYKQVGAQLSGGLDSGSVVAFAAKQLRMENRKLHTFSYTPPQNFKDFTPEHFMANETPLIKTTVKHVGGIIDHYHDFKERNSYFEIDDFLEIMEMPYKFFENSFWLKGLFEKANEEQIGVLLNGDRGNFTVSWGSALNYYAHLLQSFKWIRLYNELRKARGINFNNLKLIGRTGFPVIDNIFKKKTSSQLPSFINPAFAKRTDVYTKLKDKGLDPTGSIPIGNIVEQRVRHFEDLFYWNASNTLASKLSLRYSLWNRDPTNDLRVVRFCLSLPNEQYVQNRLDRALIRRATKSVLPDKIRLNTSVFGVQGADWVHRMIPVWDDYLNELRCLLKDKDVLEFLNGEVLKEALLKAEVEPRAEYATDPHFKILMRSLIVYRFLKKFN